MLRLLVLCVLLGAVAELREPYRLRMVPKVVSGIELMQHQPELVQFNGELLKLKFNKQGGKVYVFAVEGQQITVYAGPNIDIRVPAIGSYMQITGRMLGPGFVSVENHDMMKPLALPSQTYAEASQPAEINQRVAFGIATLRIVPPIKKEGNVYVAYRTLDGVEGTGQVPAVYAEQLQAEVPTVLKGYRQTNNYFYIEGWE